MSCYALFKGWLLLSQPPHCLRAPTAFATEFAFWDLRRRSWAVSLLSMELRPHVLTPGLSHMVFGVWLAPPACAGQNHPVLYPHMVRTEARPKAISARTSYFRVRLAFHSYPQLIPKYCTAYGFGPPSRFRGTSPWPWVAHPVSGLYAIHPRRSAAETSRSKHQTPNSLEFGI